MSLSSRRAWIEIPTVQVCAASHRERRSPRGGRGLKFNALVVVGLEIESLSSRRAWIEIMKK